MKILPVLKISGCVTLKVMPHPLKWLWIFRGETLHLTHKKSQNSIIDNTVPNTVVPRMLSYAPLCLARRVKRLLVLLKCQTKPLSLVMFKTFRYLCLSCLSSHIVCMWLVLEKAPPLSRLESVPRFPAESLCPFSLRLHWIQESQSGRLEWHLT